MVCPGSVRRAPSPKQIEASVWNLNTYLGVDVCHTLALLGVEASVDIRVSEVVLADKNLGGLRLVISHLHDGLRCVLFLSSDAYLFKLMAVRILYLPRARGLFCFLLTTQMLSFCGPKVDTSYGTKHN